MKDKVYEDIRKELAQFILTNEVEYCFSPDYGNEFSFDEASTSLIGVIEELKSLKIDSIIDFYGIDYFSEELQLKVKNLYKGAN